MENEFQTLMRQSKARSGSVLAAAYLIVESRVGANLNVTLRVPEDPSQEMELTFNTENARAFARALLDAAGEGVLGLVETTRGRPMPPPSGSKPP